MSMMELLNRAENKAKERKPEVKPSGTQAHIVDADGSLADITTQFNTLLAALEAAGILATS